MGEYRGRRRVEWLCAQVAIQRVVRRWRGGLVGVLLGNWAKDPLHSPVASPCCLRLMENALS